MTGSCDTPQPQWTVSAQEKETAFKQLQGLGPQAEQSRPANAHLQSPTGPSLQPSACFLSRAVGSRRGSTPTLEQQKL